MAPTGTVSPCTKGCCEYSRYDQPQTTFDEVQRRQLMNYKSFVRRTVDCRGYRLVRAGGLGCYFGSKSGRLGQLCPNCGKL